MGNGGAASGHGGTAGAGLPGLPTAWCGDIDALRGAILAGQPLVVVPGRVEGTVLLDRAALLMAHRGIAFVRIGNALSTPLSVGRIMFQIAGSNTYGGEGHDEARNVLQTLAERGRGATHLVVAVDQAHTLAPAALSFLKLLPGVRMLDVPPIQVVFAGGSNSYLQLAEERFRAVRDAMRAAIEAGAGPRPALLPMSRRLGMAAGLLLAAVAAGSAMSYRVLPLFGIGTSVALPTASASPADEPLEVAAAVGRPAPLYTDIPATDPRRGAEAAAPHGTPARHLPAIAHRPFPPARTIANPDAPLLR